MRRCFNLVKKKYPVPEKCMKYVNLQEENLVIKNKWYEKSSDDSDDTPYGEYLWRYRYLC